MKKVTNNTQETSQESLLKEMQRLTNERQENFMLKLLEDIEWLCEKANESNYKPTDKERECFGKIYNIVTDMNKWF